MNFLLMSLLSTFSIVAHDSDTGEWGVAVASCVPFAYHSVAWAEAEAGAIATQAWANHFYGTEGLKLLENVFKEGDTILVDAKDGEIILRPAEKVDEPETLLSGGQR